MKQGVEYKHAHAIMIALPGRPMFVCDNEKLVADASNSVFAVRNHISPSGIRHLWNGLSNFINVSLKSHKVPLQHAHLQAAGQSALAAEPTALRLFLHTGRAAACTGAVRGGAGAGGQICNIQAIQAYFQSAGWQIWGCITGEKQVSAPQ